MRIEFRLASNSLSLYGHAWEYLQEDWEGGRFLALQERSPFYRLIDGQTQTLSGKPPRPHILFAICSPNTLGQLGRVSDLRGLDVAAERKIIDDQLRERQKDELLKYEILAAEGNGRVTLDVLHNKLKQGQHNILHLVCHGKFFREGEIGKPGYYLIMEDQDGTDDLVSPGNFLEVISAREGIRLVVLAACQSAQGDEAGSALRSLGFDLVQSGIPAVVAMQKRVAVETAQEFAHHFYNDLARCGRIDMALAATRLSLKMSDVESRIPGHWGIPVLFTSIAGCGQFFSVNSKAAEDAPEGKPVVKDYAGLGASDPRPDIMGHGFREPARQLYGPGFAAAERLPVIVQDALADEGVPLAPGQNRPALDIKIKAPVDIKASDLKDFVERQSSKLSLDMLVYARSRPLSTLANIWS